jgi:hypothetical protein
MITHQGIRLGTLSILLEGSILKSNGPQTKLEPVDKYRAIKHSVVTANLVSGRSKHVFQNCQKGKYYW